MTPFSFYYFIDRGYRKIFTVLYLRLGKTSLRRQGGCSFETCPWLIHHAIVGSMLCRCACSAPGSPCKHPGLLPVAAEVHHVYIETRCVVSTLLFSQLNYIIVTTDYLDFLRIVPGPGFALVFSLKGVLKVILEEKNEVKPSSSDDIVLVVAPGICFLFAVIYTVMASSNLNFSWRMF